MLLPVQLGLKATSRVVLQKKMTRMNISTALSNLIQEFPQVEILMSYSLIRPPIKLSTQSKFLVDVHCTGRLENIVRLKGLGFFWSHDIL